MERMSHWLYGTRCCKRPERRAVEPDEILSLDKDAPDCRPPERPERGMVVQIPEVAGLHTIAMSSGRPDLASPARSDSIHPHPAGILLSDVIVAKDNPTAPLRRMCPTY